MQKTWQDAEKQTVQSPNEIEILLLAAQRRAETQSVFRVDQNTPNNDRKKYC